MKKRKVGFLFNIITICLAVVAIAVGVYSLQKSSLNISGSLGFTAHAVNARIDAYMYGYATTANGIPLTESEKVRLTSANGLLIQDTLTNYNLNLGATNGSGSATRYFSNLGASGKMEDIVVEITVSNTSGGTSTPKNILANVDFANCIPSSALTGKIRIDCDRSAAVLETTNGKTQATFIFKISLLPNSDGTYTNSALTSPSNNVKLKMNLEETNYTQSQVKTDAPIKQFTTAEISTINTGLSINDDTSYANLHPYYVEMGERNNEKVKWLIVGTFANDTVTALTDSNKTPLSQGLMLKDTTYVMLSEKVLYTESTTRYGISFQNKYTNSGFYLNDYNYSAQDYATSNIRNYLKGADDVYYTYKYDSSTKQYSPDKSKSKVNLLIDYNLTIDPLYKKIQGRTLKNLYTNIGSAGGKIWTSSYSGTEENLQPTTQDKLWLLSREEARAIFTSDNNRKTTVFGGSSSSATSWWNRSLYNNGGVNACYVSAEGDAGDSTDAYFDGTYRVPGVGAPYPGIGSRAAFLF